MLQGVLHDAKSGVFQPALKAAAAGSILIICMDDSGILIRCFQCTGYLITKVMNDHLHRLASPSYNSLFNAIFKQNAAVRCAEAFGEKGREHMPHKFVTNTRIYFFKLYNAQH